MQAKKIKDYKASDKPVNFIIIIITMIIPDTDRDQDSKNEFYLNAKNSKYNPSKNTQYQGYANHSPNHSPNRKDQAEQQLYAINSSTDDVITSLNKNYIHKNILQNSRERKHYKQQRFNEYQQILQKYQKHLDYLEASLQVKNGKIRQLEAQNSQLKNRIIQLVNAYQQAKVCFQQQIDQISENLMRKQIQIKNLKKECQEGVQQKQLYSKIISINQPRQSRSTVKSYTKISFQNKLMEQAMQIPKIKVFSPSNSNKQKQQSQNQQQQRSQYFSNLSPNNNRMLIQTDRNISGSNLSHNQNSFYQNFKTQRHLQDRQNQIEQLKVTVNKYEYEIYEFNSKLRQLQGSQKELKKITIQSLKKDKAFEDISKVVKKLQKKVKIKNKQIQDLLDLVNQRFAPSIQNTSKKTIISQGTQK